MTATEPVVALNVNTTPHYIERGLKARFIHYVTRPIKIYEFMEAMDMAVNHAHDGESQITEGRRFL